MDKPDEHYSSKIEEINADTMVIAMPMSKGYPVMLQKGGKFDGKIIVSGTVYQFSCTLISTKIHPLPFWTVSLPFDIIKVQLRSFVRIAASLSVQLKVVPAEENHPPKNLNVSAPPVYSMFTKDISGGGVLIVSKQALEAGTKVEIVLDVPECGTIYTMGEIVRVQQPQPEKPIFWVGVKFIDIQEKDRSKLIKYIFKKQLEQRQRGV